MTLSKYIEYLTQKNISSEKCEAALSLMQDFETYLHSVGADARNITYDLVQNFVAQMIERRINTEQNFVYILYYGYYLNNFEIINAIMEIIDGGEMFPNLSKQLIAKFGQNFHDEIFTDVELPPLGTHPKKKPEIAKILVSRIIDKLGPEKSVQFFKTGLRDKYPQAYVKGHETFKKLQNVDELLKIKHQTLVENLTKCFNENSLFFTQPVTGEVLDFVKSDQSISAGIRKGDTIYMKKIPYMTNKVLEETDQRKRNYYVCHNPMIREAFLEEDQPIDPIFCNCSGGFMKNYWEAVLDCEVDVELLDSVMMGGKFCEFAIHLPSEIVEKTKNHPVV
ncbi:DUF6144 family protein [Candidatus Lokiarchaeum ossiferum]|uniref:DUF6144 family protein n=1 Tax=Candidatus Lokiarchaeum ossiferum TaxID=2951803 RepID=UPI00352EF22A